MDDATKLHYLFQTLGDVNRLRIIKIIGQNEKSVSEIVEETGLSQPLVSHHLRTLRESEILMTKRRGPFIYHQLKDSKLLDALGLFLDIAHSIKGIKNTRPMFYCPPWWRRYQRGK